MNFCSNCGNKLDGGDKFCSNCGKSLILNDDPVSSVGFETVEFSSNFLLGGNILTPDKIVITSNEVVYKKRNRYLIGVDKSSIPFNRISSVEIDRKLIDADIIIYSTGNQKIKAEDFSISSAREIKRILEERVSAKI